MAESFAMHHVPSSTSYGLISVHLQYNKIVTCVLLNKDSYTGTANQSPYFAGVIAASMLWVGYGWVTRLVRDNIMISPSHQVSGLRSPPLPETSGHSFIHLAVALIFGLCVYNFVRAIALDPGACPRPANGSELKAGCVRLYGFHCRTDTNLVSSPIFCVPARKGAFFPSHYGPLFSSLGRPYSS